MSDNKATGNGLLQLQTKALQKLDCITNAYPAYFISFADLTDPLGGMSISDMSKGLIINSVSAFAAAKHAVAGFQKLPSGVPTAYIYTGNMASYLVVPETVSLGSGKNASLYFVEAAAHAYREKGYRFYFADERTPEGGSTMDLIDGNAHGEEFWKLANSKEQAPVNYTFVKGKGYVKFESDRIREVKGLHKLFKEAHDFHDGPN